jgi:hypothetical protein
MLHKSVGAEYGPLFHETGKPTRIQKPTQQLNIAISAIWLQIGLIPIRIQQSVQIHSAMIVFSALSY